VGPSLLRPFLPSQTIDEPLDCIAGFSKLSQRRAVLAGRGGSELVEAALNRPGFAQES
jgi:hypothetical protein